MKRYDFKTLEQLGNLTDNRLMGYFKARRKIINIGAVTYSQMDEMLLEMSRIKLEMAERGHIKR